MIRITGLKHPIMYDIYDICTLATEGHKVNILRDMCQNFDRSFRTRDTKAVPVVKLKEMIADCCCNTGGL